MDPVWLFVALLFGFGAQQLQLPPLVGFLLAGFALNLLGETGGPLIDIAADVGVLLLLFTIGLKLRLADFLERVIWGGASLHMLLSVILGISFLLVLGLTSLELFAVLDIKSAATIAFALSFSSTVFAVKILEERGEIRARHSLVAIGILIIQDIVAVAFLMLAEQKLPSVWALLVLGLPLIRPVLLRLMEEAGHGEVLVLFGLVATIAGAQLFDLVGLKDDFGALVFGILLSGHPKTAELSKSLLGFKDFFLLGFFLSIGLYGVPTLQDVLIVIALVIVLLPLKMALYFLLLTRLGMRARTAFLVMLSLATFSEFGLIVAVEGQRLGILTGQWLVLAAIAVAISFAAASLLNIRAHDLFQYLEKFLRRFELPREASQLPSSPGDAEVLIVGMGRVGRGAYRSMRDNYSASVCGVDVDRARARELQAEGLNVIAGDAEDIEFWRHVARPGIRLVMLALPKHEDMLTTVKLLRQVGYQGQIGAVSRYDDDREELIEAGVDAAYNYYVEAGTGFADHVQRELVSGRDKSSAVNPA